jgi:hypothetical protein
MQFLINDRVTKEIIGMFETLQEAQYYYLKNNLLERLKIYLHKLINNDETFEQIIKIRKIDNLINQISEYEQDAEINHKYSLFTTMSYDLLDCHLNEFKLLNYSFERIDDDSIKILSYKY